MCRIAWNACRSCSPASSSMWADSLASNAEPGWTCSPRALEHRRDRVLGEPVDLRGRGGACGARRRSPTSRRAWPSPIGEREVERPLRTPAARTQEHGGDAGRGRSAGRRSCSMQPVDDDRVAPVGTVAAPVDGDQLAAGQFGEGHAGRVRADAVLVAVDDEHGAAHARAQTERKLSSRTPEAARWCRPASTASDLVAPPDAVLDLLGRVRLGGTSGRRRTRGSRR